MTTIVTRTTIGSQPGKGSPLTHTEVDTNFINLNTAKLETAAIPLGTLGAPSISFLNYSTTGIYSPAGNELGVSMLGSDKIRIKSTGEIIINATASRTTLGFTPRLQIEGSASSSQCSMSLTGAGAGSSLIPRLYLSKARSSVNAVVLEDDILGLILFNGGDGSSLVNAGFIKAEVDGTPSAGIVPGRLVFATVDTAGGSGERMIIKNNGNVSIDGTTFHVDAVNNRVGIGTSNPSTALHVNGDGTFGSTSSTIIKANGDINFASNYNGILSKNSSYVYLGSTNNSVALWPNSGTNASPGLIVDNANRVGIGTTDPGSYSTYGNKLVVYGTGTNGPGMTIATGAADTGSIFFADGTTGNEAFRGAVSYSHGDDALLFQTSATEKARIRADGMFEVKGAGTAGSSPAFSVNGSAPANSAIIDTSGRLLIGTSTARANFYGTIAPQYQIEGTGLGSSMSSIISNRNDAGQSYLMLAKTRGAVVGSNTVVQSGDYCGTLSFHGADGAKFIAAASIDGVIDGTPGTDDMPGRLVFSTTADGASSPTERMRITALGEVRLNTGVPIIVPYAYATTTASAANAFIGTDGNIFRSTSSRRWKTDIEDLRPEYADNILNCRPVWYRSTSNKDNPEWGYWGFIAEEVAEIDPRLVFWKTQETVENEDGNQTVVELKEPLAEGVQYDRFVPHLLNLIKRQGEAIAELQAEVAALKAS